MNNLPRVALDTAAAGSQTHLTLTTMPPNHTSVVLEVNMRSELMTTSTRQCTLTKYFKA